MKKIVVAIMLIVVMFTALSVNVYARPTDVNQALPESDLSDGFEDGNDTDDWGPSDPGYNQNLIDNKIEGKVKDVWATVVTVVQVLAVACVVFAGLRYMFASANQKADIKQGLMYLAIGAIFVFGAITIIDIVTKTFGEVTNGV